MEDKEAIIEQIEQLEKIQENLRNTLYTNQKKISKLKEKIDKIDKNSYYVYIVYVDGEPRYVGKGTKDRYKHPISGTSSVAQLNKDHFDGKYIEVRILYGNKNLSESDALRLERECIGSILQVCYNNSKDGLYNKSKVKDFEFWDTDFYNYSEFAIANNGSQENRIKYLSDRGILDD